MINELVSAPSVNSRSHQSDQNTPVIYKLTRNYIMSTEEKMKFYVTNLSFKETEIISNQIRCREWLSFLVHMLISVNIHWVGCV